MSEEYLTLRLLRLRGTEAWQPPGTGLHFLFVRGGAGKLVTESSRERLAQGDLVVLSGPQSGKILAAGPGDVSFSQFSARIEHLYPLFSVQEISLVEDLMAGFSRARTFPAAGPLATASHRLLGHVPPHFNLGHRSYLLRIIADILDGEFKSLQSGRTGFVRIEDHMLQVFEKLTSSDLLTLSADELAAKFGCSRRHLNRLFHHHFGLSIASLRMELRMLRAVCLLQNPNAKVINVAEQCGFNHLGLFNTCFKRRFGSSPGQWRSGSVKLPDKAVVEPDDSACPFQTNGLCPKLGGPGMLNQNGSPGLQLRTAAMAAVLAIPGAPNGSRSANEAGPGGLNAPSPTNGRAPLGTQL